MGQITRPLADLISVSIEVHAASAIYLIDFAEELPTPKLKQTVSLISENVRVDAQHTSQIPQFIKIAASSTAKRNLFTDDVIEHEQSFP